MQCLVWNSIGEIRKILSEHRPFTSLYSRPVSHKKSAVVLSEDSSSLEHGLQPRTKILEKKCMLLFFPCYSRLNSPLPTPLPPPPPSPGTMLFMLIISSSVNFACLCENWEQQHCTGGGGGGWGEAMIT